MPNGIPSRGRGLFRKKKNPELSGLSCIGGGARIRTLEGVSQQIYSPLMVDHPEPLDREKV
jgi:hypothetical protein